MKRCPSLIKKSRVLPKAKEKKEKEKEKEKEEGKGKGSKKDRCWRDLRQRNHGDNDKNSSRIVLIGMEAKNYRNSEYGDTSLKNI